MESAGTVTTEAQLVAVAHRFLQSRFQQVHVLRGDGSVLFEVPSFKEPSQLMETVERLLVACVKELTGRTKLRLAGETRETDFSGFRNFGLTFGELITSAMPENTVSAQALSQLPESPAVGKMLELLYQEAVSDCAAVIQAVVDFPPHLRGSGTRVDVILKKSTAVRSYSSVDDTTLLDGQEIDQNLLEMTNSLVLQNSLDVSNANSSGHNASGLSAKFNGPCGKILLESRVLAQALALHNATPIEQALPLQWRHRAFTLAEAPEVLRLVHDSLVDYWNSNTHNDKTKVTLVSLLAIVSGDVRDYCREQILLESSDLNGPWRMNRRVLEGSLSLCSMWKSFVKLMVSDGEWRDWDGGTFRDESLDNFADRLKTVTRIRSLIENTQSLIQRVPYDVQPEQLFEGLSVVDPKKTPNEVWFAAIARFEKEFGLVEDMLRGRIKSVLQGSSGEAQLRLIRQYRVLLRRPAFVSAVDAELASSAQHHQAKLDAVKARYEAAKRSAGHSDVSKIRAAVTCRLDCHPIKESSREVFGTSSSHNRMVEERAKAIVEEAMREEAAAAESWAAAMERRLSRVNNIDTAVVVALTADGTTLTCTVDSEIQDVLVEVSSVRNLCSADHGRLSSGSERTLAACDNFQKIASRTEQLVAMLANLQHQVLPSTKPILQPSVGRCISCFWQGSTTKQRAIGFGNSAELDSINGRLASSIESFSADNRKIRKFHCEFISHVLSLHDLDLLRMMDQWRTKTDMLRNLFDEFVRKHSFDDAACANWRRHLDCQVYKALEHQYRRGLEFLHQNVQEFKVDLVFKQGQVQFKPSFDNLREQYYIKLREFVSVPLRFRGLQKKREEGDNTPYEFYPQLPAINSDRIFVVHSKAMELFARINKVRKAFREHLVVGVCGTNQAPDLDSIVETYAEDIEHWQDSYRMARERLRKLAFIEDAIKVDCFTISTAPVKATIQDHIRKLEDALTQSLRRAMQKRLSKIDDFVILASNIIERQPTTLDEVGRANKSYHEYKEMVPVYEASLQGVEAMNKLLRQAAGAAMEISLTRSRWDHLMDAMASHHKIIEASVSKMRVSIDAMIQRFFKDLQRFANNWHKSKPKSQNAFSNRSEAEKGLMYVKEVTTELKEIVQNGRELEAKCDYFKIPAPDLTLLDDTEKDILGHHEMWALYEHFELNLDALRKEDWLTFRSRTYVFEDFIKEWRDVISLKEGSGSSNMVTNYLKQLLDEWVGAVPLLKFVRGEGMMLEHWSEMFRLLEIDKGMTSDKLTFGDVLSHHKQLVAKEKEIKHLHARSQGEVQIRDALQDLRQWALDGCFTLVMPADSVNKVKLITEWKDVMTQVSDNQALLGSLKDSPYFPRFADEASGWEAKLVTVSENLLLLNNIQRRWAYLEPLFSRGALPQEQARFKRVDKEFVGILREIDADPRIMSVAQHPEYTEKLKTILEQIDRCQKALNEFLEQKRDKFPRFYFISDEDLLEVLGQSKSPSVIQSHLKKLFMGIHKVKFNSDNTTITHMLSSDDEEVKLSRPVPITDNNVEDWLIRLDGIMRETLAELLKSCVLKKDATTLEVVLQYPSQILQVAEQIFFCQATEQAIPSGQLNSVLQELQRKLQVLTSTDYDVYSNDPVLQNVVQLKTKALILDVIHNIEVVELLSEKQCRRVQEWWWQKQLRYYLQPLQKQSSLPEGRFVSNCTVRMVDTAFAYTFEYQGNAPKLVHTPLTDKCYLVLTKGMHLGYGGNPYGPAGTGKTESVKALGSALGRQVLVFNCDEGIDFKAMGRIFVGIVKCGAWGCFDEFNRLKVDQLSAISQMIQVIQEALKNGEPTTTLLNRQVEVDPNSGIFVTLNPAGKGYGGRSKLPDNLKQLFRDVAMSVPDNELITATMLLSEGFTHARTISKKVVEVYKLSKQLMSLQQHYDWGLRPLKAVLRLGGSLVQDWLRKHPKKKPSEVEESELMVKSLRINTVSKLTFDDARLFSGLIADIFPGVKVNEISYEELEAAVKTSVTDLGLQYVEAQVSKVFQLYEALRQRMGVVLVGPSGSGKSTLLKILRKAMQTMKIDVPLHAMNPKAMPRQQLLGYMDPDTREWFDGVLSAAARQVVKEPAAVRSWIFCDGDIDPEWVESLNSVLDDNKLLTMPNGVRIQFGNNVNFVFETHSLEYASPATVSRMGIIFLSEEDVHPKYTVKSHLADLPAARQDFLNPLITKYVFPSIDWIVKSGSLVVTTTRMGLLQTALNQTADAVNEADFVTSLIRGLGGALVPTAQDDFATKTFASAQIKPLSPSSPLDTYVDRADSSMKEFATDRNATVDYNDLLVGERPMVLTPEARRILQTLEPLIANNCTKPFLLVGPEGCGKSLILNNCFANEKGTKVAVINCSAQTGTQHVIQKLSQMCAVFSTNQGKVLRPKEGDRLVLALKDINLPRPDKYGTVQLHSFLQQLLLYGGYYDSDLEWVGIERVQLVGSLNPVVSAGRFPVAPRLLSIVNIVSMGYPQKDSLLHVYAAYSNAVLKSPQYADGRDYDHGRELAQFVINVFDKITARFGGEEHAHCIFCPRDVTNWISSPLRYSVQNSSLPAIMSYEASRIFADRLARAEDRSRAERIFIEQLATIGFSIPKDEKEKLLFVSWFSEWSKEGGNRPLTIQTFDTVEKEIKSAMVKYSREFKELNTVLITEVISWIARVDRVLARPGGHALLIGRAGVGRRDAVTIVSYIHRMDVVTLNLTRDYSLKAFRNDLRTIIQRCGVQNERVTLLLEDHCLIHDAFLQMINSLVSCGEVPGLFSQEELEPMLNPLREEASVEGFMKGIYAYFLARINNNLRVCLVMDPRNVLFAARCQANPALLTCCSVLWMGNWTNDGTRTMCKVVLKDTIKALEADEANRGFALHRELFAIHETQGERATPHLFRVLMNTYATIYSAKEKASGGALSRLEAGLAKLLEAEQSVAKIQEEVGKKKLEMERKQLEADQALTQIQKNMEDSKEQRDRAAELSTQLDLEQKEIVVKKAKVEEELSGIQPTLDAAKEAVGGIKAEALSEIRALKAPPEPIRDVLEGVLALLGISDVSWQSMRKFLGERGAKERILEFDARSVTAPVRENVARLLAQKGSSFKHENIVRASVAAAPMAAWVKANVEYATILERIGPLQQQLTDLETNKRNGEEKLGKLQKKLKKIDEEVDQLRKDFSSRCKEAERLKDKLEKAEKDLFAAESLLGKLSGEKTRWAEECKQIKERIKVMPRKALIAAGFITYLSRETEDRRLAAVKQWSDKLSFEAPPNVASFLRSESELLQYKTEGLPADGLSQENAVVILDSLRTPLIVDPANQAMMWLKNNLKNKDVTVEVTSMHDERFTHTLELAIRFGKTLLISEVDRIDPMLYPVLRKDLLSQGPKRVVQLGNKAVDWQDSFRIFLFSRSMDLRLSPDAAALIAEVNFSVTRFGLESQLLGTTIHHEQPELENQKVELLQKEEALKLQLAKLEESLLADLASSHGDLLQNTQLVNSLNQVKTQASAIAESLAQSSELQRDLDVKREVYRPLARLGSTIFFLVKDMDEVNRMYQYSLADFLSIFEQTLAQGNANEDVAKKIEKLSLVLAQQSLLFVSMGLFKADRVQFAAHVVHGVFPELYPEPLWNAFIGATVGDIEAAAPLLPSWAPVTSKPYFASILAIGDQSLLSRWNLADNSFWSSWMKSAAPETILDEKRSDLPTIERLLIVNAFRRDRLISAVTNECLDKLKLDAIVEVKSLEALAARARPEQPVLLVTSPGADPSMEVQETAYKLVGRNKFTQIALGGGQTDEAMQQLRRCAASGEWLFLKNLHLVLDWVSSLEKEIASMAKPHNDFRLFLTTEAHPQFPSVLLKSSLKMTFEAPPGVKQNLLRTYGGLWSDPSFLTSKSPAQAQILFGLAWFHAIMQERRTYIPQGWVKFYEFSQADLKSASDIICMMSDGSGTTDWVTIRNLFETAIYGGRLDVPQDCRVLSVFVEKIFSKETLVDRSRQLTSVGVSVPQTNSSESVVKHIFDNLGDIDPPSTFNLPENADRVVQENLAAAIMECLRGFAQKQAQTEGVSGDSWRALLSPVMDIWTSAKVKVKGPLPTINASTTVPDPLDAFFVSEVALLSALIERITGFFVEFKSVADGITIPTEKMRRDASELIRGNVPEQWLDLMDGPKATARWLQVLNKKYDAMLQMQRQVGASGGASALQQKLDLTNFLRPQTFLNALRQSTARKSGEPLIDLVLAAYLSSGGGRSGAIPVTISSETLLLQGAKVAGGSRIEVVDNNAPSTAPFTDLVVSWVPSAALAAESARYTTIPLYTNSQRESLVMEVLVPCGGAPERDMWTMSGAAAFLTTV
jgi:dynein heavy chain 2